jgi:hypothetical protein
MEHGKGLYTPVVFTLEDLKKIYDNEAHGKKGMWAFHSKFHQGHGLCAVQTNRVCDWVVGILWNNFASGMRWMVGDTIDIDGPIRTTDIEVLKSNSDVVMIFTGDYHPYKPHWKKIKQIIDQEFPESFLKEKGITEELNIYSSLIYSIAIRLVIHEIYGIKLDYHASCGRDRWRHVKYRGWVKQRFGLELELHDAVRDSYGNVISGMRSRVPDEYNKRINKPLLLPEFESLEEVNDYIKDIPDLKALHFAKEFGWIHVKFQFADKHWWSEGLKLCKS